MWSALSLSWIPDFSTKVPLAWFNCSTSVSAVGTAKLAFRVAVRLTLFESHPRKTEDGE
jgi:hypothetical protein